MSEWRVSTLPSANYTLQPINTSITCLRFFYQCLPQGQHFIRQCSQGPTMADGIFQTAGATAPHNKTWVWQDGGLCCLPLKLDTVWLGGGDGVGLSGPGQQRQAMSFWVVRILTRVAFSSHAYHLAVLRPPWGEEAQTQPVWDTHRERLWESMKGSSWLTPISTPHPTSSAPANTCLQPDETLTQKPLSQPFPKSSPIETIRDYKYGLLF